MPCVGRSYGEGSVGASEGTNHGGGVINVPSSNEVFEEWKARVVDWYVGRGLRLSSHGTERAGQSRREEEWAHRCRHRGET
jgi:hypothetical protein